MSEKTEFSGLRRLACWHGRRSSTGRVRGRPGIRRRQYDLEARVGDSGIREVAVADEGLGIRGAGTRERPGFGHVGAVVFAGSVGTSLALEASWLARNRRGWHPRLDLRVVPDRLVRGEVARAEPCARESRRRQYDLGVRARQVGFREVALTGERLGVRGGAGQERPGFKRQGTVACEERVGVVLAWEASRLALTRQDWHERPDGWVVSEKPCHRRGRDGGIGREEEHG